jgi:hypothetical protein
MGKSTRGERLKTARRRYFPSARAAALAMEIPPATYGAHERAQSPGGRDYGPDEAIRYGSRFRVTAEWLLTGVGEEPGAPTDLARVQSESRLTNLDFDQLTSRLMRLLVSMNEHGEVVNAVFRKLNRENPDSFNPIAKRLVERFQKLELAIHRTKTISLSMVKDLYEMRAHSEALAASFRPDEPELTMKMLVEMAKKTSNRS